MINKQLMLVAMLSVGTALTTMGKVKPALASLTPPTTYDYSYTWNAAASEQYLNVNGVDSIPLYTKTADGIYWNYTSIFNVIDDLSVTMTFNRSNTTWQSSGTSWKPDQDKIGSDNTVGTINTKWSVKIVNNTKNDFYIFLDNSSTGGTFFTDTYANPSDDVENSVAANFFNGTTAFNKYFIASYTTFRVRSSGTGDARYLDAWYLQNLGISQSYQAGLDAETNGILTDYLGTDAQQIGWVLLGIAAILFVMKGGK